MTFSETCLPMTDERAGAKIPHQTRNHFSVIGRTCERNSKFPVSPWFRQGFIAWPQVNGPLLG